MNKLWKLLIGLLALVVVVLVAVAVAVALLVDPEDYRPLIVNAVEDATGRQLTLEGDLDLSLFPCCAVAMGKATLSNPKGFPEEPFASLDSAAASLRLWPLITRREVQIGTVTLNGLHLRLAQRGDGTNNWTFETEEAAAPDDAAAEGEDSALEGLRIAGLEIADSEVRFTDLESGTTYSASQLRLRTGAIDAQLQFPLEFSAALAESARGAAAQVSLQAKIQAADAAVVIDDAVLTLAGADALAPADLRLTVRGAGHADADGAAFSGTFELPGMSPRGALEALSVPYRPADPDALSRLSGSGSWRFEGNRVSLSGLSFQLDDTTLGGSVTASDLATGALQVDLEIGAVDLDRYLPADDATSAATPAAGSRQAAEPTSVPLDALRDLPLQAKIRLTSLRASGLALDKLALDLANSGNQLSLALSAHLGDGSFELTGAGNLDAAKPALSGDLRLTSLSPRALLEATGEAPETADPGVLSSLSGSAHWRLDSRSLGLDKLSLQLDQTRVTGSLRINDFDRLATTAELRLDRLDMDRYLPPESEEAAAEAGDALATEIPVELIRELDVKGTLAAGELKVLNLALRQVSASIAVKNGVLRLDPLSAALYGGQYRGVISIDASGASADLDLSQQIQAVQIGELLRDYAGADRISGALTLELSGSGPGNTMRDLLQNLDGNLSARLDDGMYHGMDIEYEIQRARALLKKQTPPAAPGVKNTQIRQLSLTGSLTDGVLGSDDLRALLPGLRVSGKGGVNLVEQSLDYRLLAEVLKGDSSAAGDGLQDLVDLAIPLSIEGPLSSPAVGVDLKDLLTRSARDAVEKKARSLLLDKLGGGKSSEPAPQQPATTAPTEQPSSAAAKEAPAQEAESSEAVSTKDLLKRGLRDLLRTPPQEAN